MRKIASVLLSIERALTRINTVVVVVCGAVLFLFVLMVVSDVTGRYLFLHPVGGTQEVGEIVLALVVFMGWAAVLANRQHIRVLIMVDRLPLRWRAWLELLALAVGLAMMVPIAKYSISFAIDSYVMKEVGYTVAVPRYPGKMAFAIGSTLFAIQFLIALLNRLLATLSGQITEAEIPVAKEQI
jgi:TRAP-type C4-dicarboxylate transport system permease small subunit